MSSKRKYSKQDIISIHQFIEMCGLNCNINNFSISHKEMCKQLKFQNQEIFGRIKVPTPLAFRTVTTASLKAGTIVLVEDDYGKVCPYQKPMFQYRKAMFSTTPEEQEKTRKRIIEEMAAQEIPEEAPLKPGEAKYFKKQTNKREVQAYIDMLIEKEIASYKELEQEEKAKNLKLMI